MVRWKENIKGRVATRSAACWALVEDLNVGSEPTVWVEIVDSKTVVRLLHGTVIHVVMAKEQDPVKTNHGVPETYASAASYERVYIGPEWSVAQEITLSLRRDFDSKATSKWTFGGRLDPIEVETGDPDSADKAAFAKSLADTVSRIRARAIAEAGSAGSAS